MAERLALRHGLQQGPVQKLLADNLDQHVIAVAAVKLTVKDLFQQAKTQTAIGDGTHHIPSHDLSLQMGIPVVFARAVMATTADRIVRSQFLQPLLVIGGQPYFVVVHQKHTVAG